MTDVTDGAPPIVSASSHAKELCKIPDPNDDRVSRWIEEILDAVRALHFDSDERLPGIVEKLREFGKKAGKYAHAAQLAEAAVEAKRNAIALNATATAALEEVMQPEETPA